MTNHLKKYPFLLFLLFTTSLRAQNENLFKGRWLAGFRADSVKKYIIGFTLSKAAGGKIKISSAVFTNTDVFSGGISDRGTVNMLGETSTKYIPGTNIFEYKQAVDHEDNTKTFYTTATISLILPATGNKIDATFSYKDMGLENKALVFRHDPENESTMLMGNEIPELADKPGTKTEGGQTDPFNENADPSNSETGGADHSIIFFKLFGFPVGLPGDFLRSGLWFILASILIHLLFRWFQYRYFHDRLLKENLGEKQEPVLAAPERYYPMVRIGNRGRWFGREKVLIVGTAGIGGCSKNKSQSVEALHAPDWLTSFEQIPGIFNRKYFTDDNIERVTVARDMFTGKGYLKIATAASYFGLTLPKKELPTLLAVLQHRFGSKFEVKRFRRYGKDTIMCTIIALLGVLAAIVGGITGKEVSIMKFYIFLVAGILLFINLMGVVYHRFILTLSVKKVDRSQRKQWRSPILALLFKITGLFLFVLWLVWKIKGDDFTWPESLSFVNSFYQFVAEAGTVPILFIVGNIAFFAMGLSPKAIYRPQRKQEGQTILYLRSFLDDGITSLNQSGSRWARWSGVENPYTRLSQLEPNTWIYKIHAFFIRYFYGFHPVRILRVLLGRPLDTSEEQLASYFRRYGQLTAIGKPGEFIVTPGAARLYVSNADWQQKVLELLAGADHVVLQPNHTEGVWWEIEQVLRYCPPEKLILCLINYRGLQEHYEQFRVRFESLRPGMHLPKHLGNEKRTAFLHFTTQWECQLVYARDRPRIQWFFKGMIVDLDQTLNPCMTSQLAMNN